jgi:hypothetical protein
MHDKRERGHLAFLIIGEAPTFDGVFLDEFFPISGHIRIDKNGGYRTFGFTQAAVYAFVRIDEKHVVALVNAVDRADNDAGLVFYPDAGLGDHVWHTTDNLPCGRPPVAAPSEMFGAVTSAFVGLSRLTGIDFIAEVIVSPMTGSLEFRERQFGFGKSPARMRNSRRAKDKILNSKRSLSKFLDKHAVLPKTTY